MSNLDIKTEEKPISSYLRITTKEQGKVFEINADGSVGYTVKGKYRIANNDKKLGIALGETFKAMVKINEASIKKQNERNLSKM